MKSIVYIKWISVMCVLMMWHTEAKACWDPSYKPSEINMYYPELEDEKENNAIANCELWQKQTSTAIPVEDIYEVVYEYKVEDVETLLTDSLKSSNKFVRWIVSNKDKELVDFLVLAKRCEKLRKENASMWYYPSKGDSNKYNLLSVIKDAKEYKGYRFKSRYVLQAVRAMYTLGEFDDCCEYWAAEKMKMPNNVLKRMAMGYVAGCEFKRGNKSKAKELYLKLDDLGMIIECVGQLPSDDVEKFEMMLKYAPNNKEMMWKVAEKVSKIDERGVDSWRWNVSKEEMEERCRRLMEMCVLAAKKKNVNDKRFWWYSAAVLADKLGSPNEALIYVTNAEKYAKSVDHIETLKVMRIYLTAKTLKCDDGYEAWLWKQMKWYASKMETKKEYPILTIGALKSNSSTNCYFNDMLRKMVLGEAFPRLVKSGRGVFALQVANMADNYYLHLCGKVTDYNYEKWDYDTISLKEYRATVKTNEWDYSNMFFTYLNYVKVDDIVKYVQKSLTPQNERDRYFAKRSYVDKDYLYDIAGTMLLRNMRYAEAEKYLCKVTYGYQKRLNTEWYLQIDPFDYGYRVRKESHDAKYEFAKEMRELEDGIKANSDSPNRKAKLMMRYALGMRKSVGESWALTQYFKGYMYSLKERLYEDIDYSFEERANKRADEIEAEALAMITDEELGAYCNALLYNYKAILTKYKDTDYARYLERTCDSYKDYIKGGSKYTRKR